MWDCATPATQNEGGYEIVPHLPRKSAAASRATKTSPSAPPSAISATPATQNEGGCEIVPRLPRETHVDVTKCHASHTKVPRRPGRLKPAQARHPVPQVPRLPRQTATWNKGGCHQVPRLPRKDGMWKIACDKGVCVCVKFVCVKLLYVKDGMWQRCVWSYVCDRWYVTKLCVKFVCVWSYCMWKMVCDKVVCEVMYVTDGVWQSCVLTLCVCEVIVCAGWYVTKLCVKFVCVKLLYVRDGVWQAEGGGRREDRPGIQNQKQEPHTKLWGTINLYKNGLSSAYPRGRALFPFGTVVKSRRNGINSCSSSSELDAQYFRPHQKTIKRKRPHLESMSLPATSFMVMCRFKSLSCSGKKEVSGC